MWKSIFVKVIRVVALTVLLAQFTFSSALAHNAPDVDREVISRPLPKPPAVSNSPAPESPKTPASPKNSVGQFLEVEPESTEIDPTEDYDISAIKQFNDDLYGKEAN